MLGGNTAKEMNTSMSLLKFFVICDLITLKQGSMKISKCECVLLINA